VKISKKSLFCRIAYLGVREEFRPQKSTICKDGKRFLLTIIGLPILMVVAFLVCLVIDVYQFPWNGKSSLFAWYLMIRGRLDPQKGGAIVTIPHCHYRGVPLPRIILALFLTPLILWQAYGIWVMFLGERMLEIFFGLAALAVFSGLLYHAVKTLREEKEHIRNTWGAFILWLKSLKDKTCLGIEYVD